MNSDVEKWQSLSDEEKQKVLDAFRRGVDNLDYKKICHSNDQLNEIGHGSYEWEHPVLILRLADKRMTHQILSWLHQTVETSQGPMHIPFGGYFLEELAFDKSSLMAYSDDEKEVLRQAMKILQNKGVG